LLGGDHCHHGLRAIPAGHRERVGSVGDRLADQLLEVGSELQFDRLDPTGASLLGQVEPLGLPSTRLRVVEERGVPWIGAWILNAALVATSIIPRPTTITRACPT
jgi:hypothetical protein